MIEGDPNNDIWIYELERGIQYRLTSDTPGSRPRYGLRTEPEIIFDTLQAPSGGGSLLQRTPSDGWGVARTLAKSPKQIGPTNWSRDGKYVLVNHGPSGRQRSVYALAGTPTRPSDC